MKKIHFALFAILLLTLMGCAEKEIALTKEHLEKATLENFVVSEEVHNQVQYVLEEKIFPITNLLTQEVTANGTMYFFLETDTKTEPLLVVLNEDLNKLQWGEYYAENTESIVVTKETLEEATLENFVLVEELSDQLFYVFEETFFAIKNLLVQEVNPDGIMYLFLEPDTKNEQLLVVLNEDLSKLQWAEYYTEHCYFDPEGLVAFVVEPLPDRYQEVTFKIYDFKEEFFREIERDLSRFSGNSVGDKQPYYITPVYEKLRGINNTPYYYIYWKQAHYSFYDDKYTVGYSRSVDYSTLDELEPLLATVNEWAIPAGYDAIAGNTNENYDVVFIAPEGEEVNWENCEIFYYNKETEKSMQVLFASIFRYQDELLGITTAQNKDERVAFIVETKEFNYDFYFDPAGLTTDAFLRPSSYDVIQLM